MEAINPLPIPASKRQMIFKNLRWGTFAFICLIFFTIFNFPDAKVKAWIQTTLTNELSARGMSLSAQKTSLSTLFGIKYQLQDAVLMFPPPQPPVKIDTFSISPSLLSLLTGKFGASIYLKANGGGALDAFVSMRPDMKTGMGPMFIDVALKNLNIGKLGVLSLLSEFKASAIADGSIKLDYDPLKPNLSEGKINLKLSQIRSDVQNISSFNIPALSISQGEIRIDIDKGVVLLKTVQIGKEGSSDDLIAKATGDITLGKMLDASQLKVNTVFSLSKNVLGAPGLSILETLMTQAKQPDGKYSYDLRGMLGGPDFSPAGSGSSFK